MRPTENNLYVHTSDFDPDTRASRFSDCAGWIFGTAEVTGLTLANIGFRGCVGISAYEQERSSISGGVLLNKPLKTLTKTGF